MAVHVKKGDTVEVITGDDRGVRGRVLSVNVTNRTVVVEGVNRVHRHVKPSRRNPQGGRLLVELPVDMSNVQPISPKTDRPTRVRSVIDESGQKTRSSIDGSVIDVIRRTKS